MGDEESKKMYGHQDLRESIQFLENRLNNIFLIEKYLQKDSIFNNSKGKLPFEYF